MEGLKGSTCDAVATGVRKKRSNTSRRPRAEAHTVIDSPPPPDYLSTDHSNAYGNSFSKKEFNLNQTSSHKFRKDDGAVAEFDSSCKSSSDGVHTGSDMGNWKSSQSKRPDSHLGARKSGELSDGDNKPRKVKLKVGGVTHTIHPKSSSIVASASSMKPSRSSDASRPRPKLILQDMSDDDEFPPSKSSSGKKDDVSRANMQLDESVLGKQFEATRKSKRVPKPRVFSDDGNEFDEIRYLERMKTPKKDHGAEDEEDKRSYEGGVKKERKVFSVSRSSGSRADEEEDLGYRDREGKRKSSSISRPSEKIIIREDTEDEEEEDDDDVMESEEMKRKKQKRESIDALMMDGKKEMSSLTTRQRAMQKDSGSLIEYPNGLPPAAPRKQQKEKLSEVEQQLKKAEAAQRRRMQVEKAAKESEAEAIRKILGQDSSRKKREDKMKKRRDEIAQEKAANAMTIPPNTIRWVLAPTGTVVTFPQEMGLPGIFTSKPPCYPPPREKCAASSCTNPYKYRDSKTKLPLCSLECYKAVSSHHPLPYHHHHPSAC